MLLTFLFQKDFYFHSIFLSLYVISDNLFSFLIRDNQAQVVEKVDNAIHGINLYPLDSAICFLNKILIRWIVIYPMESAIHLLKSRGQNLKFLHWESIFIGNLPGSALHALLLQYLYAPREDKGDREGIPHTHPIP